MNRQFYSNNDLRKKIQDYSYGLKDIIGKGFSSVVYRGLDQKNKQPVAIKVIDIKSIQGKPEKKMLQGQIDALKKLNHSNILKCHDIYSTANNCYIITQFCNEGDLETLIKKRSKLSELQATPIIKDILDGFLFFGQAGFLHRDLKPANIFMKDKSAKIADFGFAKRVTSNSRETVNVGSPLYMSPQGLNSNIYTIKNDVWSIGIIIYEVLHGKVPWTCSTEDQLKIQIQRNNISLLKNLCEDLKDFIRKCLIVDQNRRMGLKEVASHPFFIRISEDQTSNVPFIRKPTSKENQLENVRSQKCLIPNLPTEVDVEKNKPKLIHHNKNSVFSGHNAEKQLHCQINWMRFLYKLNELFPKITESGRSTLNLRFIICKQLFSQLHNLKINLQGENVLKIDGWKQFSAQKQQTIKYMKILEDYTQKYKKNRKDFEEWIEVVQKDKKMNQIADRNMMRSENLCLLGINSAIEQCKQLWKRLKEKAGAFGSTTSQINNNQNINPGSPSEDQLPSSFKQQLLRLDFIITYYQLNCIFVENFNNVQYFTKQSKLEYITQYKPVGLGLGCMKDIENKLRLLQIVK